MNRYTYKAKRKDNGEWVYGYYWMDENFIHKITVINDNSNCYEIIPETLCQCVGLKDIEGNYIFENDILERNYTDGKKHVVGIIKYGNFNCSCCDGVYGYYLEDNFGDDGDIRNLKENTNLKIMGNKYDKEE